MAISEDLVGIEVTIVQEGQSFREYTNDLVEDGRTVTRFVKATSGEPFAILLKAGEQTVFKGDSLGCDIYIDGKLTERPLINESRSRVEDQSRLIEGVMPRDKTIKKFRFADLEVGA